MRTGFPLLTRRLVLRPFEAGDLADLFAYLSRAEVARYLYAEPLTDRSQAEQDVRRKMTADHLPEEHQTLVLAVVWPPAERVIGDVMLHYSSHPHKQGEIGYVFNPDYHGQGFAIEAARAMLELGFQALALHRIVARCDARNLASLRVMERLGMTREAQLVENEFVKGEWTDEFVYAIREDTWRAQLDGRLDRRRQA
jgi:RimJ/RimL family protein N-acetyltransferase